MIKVFYFNDCDLNKLDNNVACIGFFDGVHKGHQVLISKTIELANSLNVEPYLITFYPDPLDIIKNNKNKHINSLNKRIKLFEEFGIKGVIIIDFNKDVMSLKPNEFVQNYLNKIKLKGLVCGFDFHYGYKGQGDYASLKKDLKNIPVYMIEEVKYYGKKISSTRIKEELKKENYKLVDKLLGYHYENK